MVCCANEEEDPVLEKQGLTGPVENRRCRDIPCLLLYIVFWIGLIVVAGIAFSSGDPRRIVYGTDSWGNVCDRNNDPAIPSNLSGLDLTGYKFLYFDPESDLRVCVEECPNITSDFIDCTTNEADCVALGVCLSSPKYNDAYVAARAAGQTNANEATPCPARAYRSNLRFGLRRCIASDVAAAGSSVAKAFANVTQAEEVMSDIVVGHRVIGLGVGLACVLSIVMVFLMRCFGKVIIYSLIAAGMLGTLALSIVTYTRWNDIDDRIDEQKEAGDPVLDSDERNERFLFGIMIAAFVFTSLVWIVIIALRNRIRLAVAIFEEASVALRALPQLFLMPVWTNLVLIGYVAVWLVVYVYMITRGDAMINADKHAEFQDSEDSRYRQQWWYLILALFWNTQFILAFSQLVVAGAICSWYFNRDKSELSWTVTKSAKRGVRYHMGSVAFGSLIIAIIQIIRSILYYIKERTKDKDGVIVGIIIKCCMCCFWCLQKFFEFINKNAYIMIAIRGYSFCGATTRVFRVLGANLLRVVTLNTVTHVILFTCKLFVVGLSCIATYYYIQNDEELDEDLHYWGPVVFFVGFLAWFVADLFLEIYDMAIDTIFICWAEDSDMNNGQDKPYFMSDNLLKFMNDNARNTAGVEKMDDVEEAS
eukprot:TRINITY_DN7282_c1_g2_i2.p1 TRINITY_DN7282_c1_g2~~TRINITY_DN7282_c1_g2_i2.p1  ORF type:complete len:670 (+),score=191.83 TRINITY_DN7282_c1_g2_i2:67-2010(+)